jgi:hypothetical protein
MTIAAGRFVALNTFTPGIAVSVFNVGTKVLATLYADRSTGTTVSNPTVADLGGTLNIFAVAGDYDLSVPTGDEVTTTTISVRPDPLNAWTG